MASPDPEHRRFSNQKYRGSPAFPQPFPAHLLMILGLWCHLQEVEIAKCFISSYGISSCKGLVATGRDTDEQPKGGTKRTREPSFTDVEGVKGIH